MVETAWLTQRLALDCSCDNMPIPQVPSPLLSVLMAETYNAEWFSGSTDEQQIQNAINAAAADGAKYVFIPANMLGYNASLVTFNNNVHMIREGGNSAVFDVLAYGATGDGISDDTVAIQQACTLCPDGGIVWLPAQYTFLITSTVTFGGEMRKITGGGAVTFSGITAIKVVDLGANQSEGNAIEDISFNGLGVAGGTAILVTNIAHDCLETQIRHCNFLNCPTAISTTIGFGGGPHEMYVMDCLFTNSNLAGSVAVNLASGDNMVRGCRIRGYDTGIKISQGSQRILANHWYQFPSSSMTYCIDVSQSVTAANRISIIGNEFDGSPSSAYLGFASFNARDTTVQGNFFLCAPTAGPCVAFTASAPATEAPRFTITGNTFYSTAATKANVITFDANTTGIGASSFLYIQENTFFQCSPIVSTSIADVNNVGSQAGPNFQSVPLNGCTIIMTLTGAVAVQNLTSANQPPIGTEVLYVFIQDGAGAHAVTWGTTFKVTWSDAGNAATKRSTMRVKWDGTNWNQIGAQSPYA